MLILAWLIWGQKFSRRDQPSSLKAKGACAGAALVWLALAAEKRLATSELWRQRRLDGDEDATRAKSWAITCF